MKNISTGIRVIAMFLLVFLFLTPLFTGCVKDADEDGGNPADNTNNSDNNIDNNDSDKEELDMQKNILAYASPESQGLPSEAVISFMEELEAKKMNMHSFMLMKNSTVLAECYWPYFSADKKHRMYSVSKSFTSLAIGMMIDEGKISLDDKVADFFPEYLPDGADPYLLEATVRNLLMMSSVYDSIDYTKGDDWVQCYFQDTGKKHAPGTVFNYDTGATVVLCGIVEKLSGKPMLEYMRPVLDEIGISDDIWCIKSPDGRSWTGSGVMCTTEDFARFALLCMNKGEWNGKQLISREYVEAATSFQIDNSAGGFGSEFKFGYGYQFWRLRDGGFACFGMGGQLALCLPELDLLLITTADNQALADGIDPIVKAFFNLAAKINETPLPENTAAQQNLNDKIASVSTRLPEGEKTTENAENYSGVIYDMEQNKMGIKWVSLDISDEICTLNYENDTGEHNIKLGMGEYASQKFPEKYYGATIGIKDTNYDSIAAAAWKDNNALTGIIYSIDDHLGSIKLDLTFSEGKLNVRMSKAAEFFFDSYQGSANGYVRS